MKKRLKQAFLETSILLGWLGDHMINEGENISDELWKQMMYAEKKYDKMARRLGRPTRSEELNAIMNQMETSSGGNDVELRLIINE